VIFFANMIIYIYVSALSVYFLFIYFFGSFK